MHTANTSRAAPPMSSLAPYPSTSTAAGNGTRGAATSGIGSSTIGGSRSLGTTTLPQLANQTGTLALTSGGMSSVGGAPMLSHAGRRPKDRLDNKLMALSLERTANLSSKERHMALYLKKFSEGKAELAQRAIDEEHDIDDAIAAQRANERDARLTRLAENQRFKQEWKESGDADWRRNQANAKARVLEEEKFVADTEQKALTRKEKKRTDVLTHNIPTLPLQ
jgi:hypothetical protein